MSWLTFLHQLLSLWYFHLQDFIKIVKLLLGALSINVLTNLHLECTHSLIDSNETHKKEYFLWNIWRGIGKPNKNYICQSDISQNIA